MLSASRGWVWLSGVPQQGTLVMSTDSVTSESAQDKSDNFAWYLHKEHHTHQFLCVSVKRVVYTDKADITPCE